MDAGTNAAIAALVVAMLAFVVAFAQALQQYFITGQLIRLCDSVVFGDLPRHGRRVWQMSQLRFRVVYEIPQVGTDPRLWPSSATASLARTRTSMGDVLVPRTGPGVSHSPLLLTTSRQSVKKRSWYGQRWGSSGVAGSMTARAGEASWASFVRAVRPSCDNSTFISLTQGDADRCPTELPTVPMPASLRDTVVMALMAGMECTAASFERGSVSLQGEVGTITSAQHPVLGPIIHFSLRNSEGCQGIGLHGSISKDWLRRITDTCVVAGRPYNKADRKGIERHIGIFSTRPRDAKTLVPFGDTEFWDRLQERVTSAESGHPSEIGSKHSRVSRPERHVSPENKQKSLPSEKEATGQSNHENEDVPASPSPGSASATTPPAQQGNLPHVTPLSDSVPGGFHPGPHYAPYPGYDAAAFPGYWLWNLDIPGDSNNRPVLRHPSPQPWDPEWEDYYGLPKSQPWPPYKRGRVSPMPLGDRADKVGSEPKRPSRTAYTTSASQSERTKPKRKEVSDRPAHADSVSSLGYAVTGRESPLFMDPSHSVRLSELDRGSEMPEPRIRDIDNQANSRPISAKGPHDVPKEFQPSVGKQVEHAYVHQWIDEQKPWAPEKNDEVEQFPTNPLDDQHFPAPRTAGSERSRSYQKKRKNCRYPCCQKYRQRD
ncbi:hypothetical protein GE09DRAFT_244276 [Coniochaeta sp. 2T2.1]|nr:hypothetical protein GE09DRAFT_244276 [Coniochaeta sp. 2T2.1]